MFRILALGNINISEPTVGDARMAIGTLGSLALKGHQVLYLHQTRSKRKERDEVQVVHGTGQASIEIRDIEISATKILNRDLFPKKESITEIVKRAQAFRPDILYSESCNDPTLLYAAKAVSVRLKVPWILRMDNLAGFFYKERYQLTHDPKEIVLAPVRVAYYGIASGLTDATAVVSHRLEKRLRKLGLKNVATIEPTYLPITSKCVTLNCQAEAIVEQAEQLSPYGLMIEKVAGAKHHRAYQRNFFTLLITLAKKLPTKRFVAVGPDRAWLTDLALSIGTELPHNVHATGLINDQRLLSRLYGGSCCVLIPDRYMPGVSTSLVETFYHGKVAVATTAVACSLRDVVDGKHAFIDDDYANWALHVLALFEDPDLRKEMEKASHDYFKKQLSVEVQACRYEALFSTVLNKT